MRYRTDEDLGGSLGRRVSDEAVSRYHVGDAEHSHTVRAVCTVKHRGPVDPATLQSRSLDERAHRER